MEWDLTVTSVVNVFYQVRKEWIRDICKPRGFDAMVLFTHGEIEYNFADQTVVARQGDILLLPGNLPYSGKRHTDLVAYYVIDFLCSDRDGYRASLAPRAVRAPYYDSYASRFSQALDVWERHRTNANFHIKSLLYEVLADLTETENQKRCGIQNEQTERILAYIAEHFTDPTLTGKGLCKQFFISESQLRRNMKAVTGKNINDYIVTLRLNKAKRALSDTGKTVQQISLECGFSSPFYFSRCFSDHVGMSPVTYRAITRM